MSWAMRVSTVRGRIDNGPRQGQRRGPGARLTQRKPGIRVRDLDMPGPLEFVSSAPLSWPGEARKEIRRMPIDDQRSRPGRRQASTAPSHASLTKSSSATSGLDGLSLVGIRTRGVPLAEPIGEQASASPSAGKRAADTGDARHQSLPRRSVPDRGPIPVLRKDRDLPSSWTVRCIVLVDDVLFTGRTIRAALDGLMDLGGPRGSSSRCSSIAAIANSRSGPDFVGKNVPTSRERTGRRASGEEVDGTDEVVLVIRARAPERDAKATPEDRSS